MPRTFSVVVLICVGSHYPSYACFRFVFIVVVVVVVVLCDSWNSTHVLYFGRITQFTENGFRKIATQAKDSRLTGT